MRIIQKMNTFKTDWIDVVFIKTGVFFATLFFAKIYEPILQFGWYWYLLIWLIISVRPVINYFKWFRSIE
jgi:hypothetical protein